ncbi:hypothetical protein [Arthrobacter sp. D1-17]
MEFEPVLGDGAGVGMGAIEVKGGKVGVENGQWYQSDTKRPFRPPAAFILWRPLPFRGKKFAACRESSAARR